MKDVVKSLFKRFNEGRLVRVWVVATYGDGGIELTYHLTELAYNRAMRKAERRHKAGEFDTYMGDWVEIRA